MEHTPIKRHQALKEVSREHHHGLLLCWKIRMGLSKKVAPERIKSYSDWFYKNYLVDHFKMEELHIFPIIGNDHPWVKAALMDHQKLKRLFTTAQADIKTLAQIEETLEAHIRFEERQLFNYIQQMATPSQMHLLEKHHAHEKFKDNTDDPFWN